MERICQGDARGGVRVIVAILIVGIMAILILRLTD